MSHSTKDRGTESPCRRLPLAAFWSSPRACWPPAAATRRAPTSSSGTSTPTPAARTRSPPTAPSSRWRIHDQHPGPPPGRRSAADPARSPARRGRPGDRPDEPRPALHRRVRRRRLPRRDPLGPADEVRGAGLRERRGRRHVGGPAGGRAVLVQHPGAVVPQVLRRQGRPRHEPAGHAGTRSSPPPRTTAARWRSRPTSTRATRCGSTPWSPAPAARSPPTPSRGADADITIASEAGQAAAEVVEELASSEAAPADLSVSNEGTAATTFGADDGAFMVNWTFIWGNYGEERLGDDIGFAPLPRRPSRARSPAAVRRHRDRRQRLLRAQGRGR